MLIKSRGAQKSAARLSWALCLLMSVGLLYWGLLGFIAEFQITSASYNRKSLGSADLSGAAAALAIEMAPWKFRAWIESGTSDLASGRSNSVSAHQAIYWSSADAQPWALMARQLIMDRHYEFPFKAVTLRIADLAPNSPSYQMELSIEGVYAWNHGDNDLHRLWLDNIFAALRRNPHKLLFNVVSMQKEAQFCAYAVTTAKLRNWCTFASSARQGCSTGKLTADQSAWCHTSGFTTAKKSF